MNGRDYRHWNSEKSGAETDRWALRGTAVAVALLFVALGLVSPQNANAQAVLVDGFGGPDDFGTAVAHNDDGFHGPVDVSSAFPSSLNFFGSSYDAIHINTNGNITFGGPVSTYTPEPFPIAARPMIAPWWGDVDTRNQGGAPANTIYYYVDSEHERVVVTWFEVGYYGNHVDKTNSFQLILTQRSDGDPGDFDVEFRYNRCEWTTGDASGGSGGLGGTPAQAGFDAGNLTNYLQLTGSRTAAVLNLCSTSNVDDTGVWLFEIRSGTLPGIPIAFDDEYGIFADAVLQVSAPGVLENDLNPLDGPLTAGIRSYPSHGSLQLQSDGSFTYAPTYSDFYGVDTFLYTINNGVNRSGPATVTIYIDSAYDDRTPWAQLAMEREAEKDCCGCTARIVRPTSALDMLPLSGLILLGLGLLGVVAWRRRSR